MEQLKKLLSTYRLKALRIDPIENGYLIETNKGRKVVTIWDNAYLLKWSNQWRERMFAKGVDGVERFLVNNNKKKYIRYQGKYFVLSNAPVGSEADFSKMDQCLEIGELFAKFHLALDQIDRGKLANISHTSLDEPFFSEGDTAIKQVMSLIEQKEHPALTDELVYQNLPLLYKRFRRAFELWEGIRGVIDTFPLSLSRYLPKQMLRNETGWNVGGGYNQPLGPLHQDTVYLIRQIYENSSWNVEAVLSFLRGYENQRKLTDNEMVFILVQMAVPFEVWPYIKDYFKQGALPEDQVESFVEVIRRQKYWDDLAVHVARVIDHRRNEATA